MSADGSPVVTLYGRPGCHLCDQARDLLLDLRGRGNRFELHEIDIESDDELLRRYLERIPVVEVEGEIAGELVLDADALAARIATVAP